LSESKLIKKNPVFNNKIKQIILTPKRMRRSYTLYPKIILIAVVLFFIACQNYPRSSLEPNK